MSVAQISIRDVVYRRLHAFAAVRNVTMVSVIEAALSDESTWSARGLSAKATMPVVELPAEMVLALRREADRMNVLEPVADHTVRSLLDQILGDALDKAGAP